MSSQHGDPESRQNEDDNIPCGFFRRRLSRLHNVPVGVNREQKLSLTTSRGRVYMLDQFTENVPQPVKNHAIAILSEFVGTFLFLFIGIVGNSVMNNDAAKKEQLGGGSVTADPAKGLYIALVWGLSTIVNAWAFFRISGGLFNPAVSAAMMIIRAVDPVRGVLCIVTQMVASIVAAAIAYGLLPPGSLPATELGEQTSITQGVFIEMFLTTQVVLAIFMLATEKHKATFIAPVGIGLAVFACVLAGQSYTGASLNPARSFAICVVQGSFPAYHWIYWVGPGLGALLAVAFYLLIRKLEYWTVSPDIDEYQSHVGEQIIMVKDRA
ncbi:Aquaporin-1 [Didymosphaeria variabile]|uniref:Aquaporin-1 n=1 Tax=Didymosphaeria variabile TaxID=1932322 RepID=A0A9W8XJV2_9PLEO|nr:Aquaporin-1 [Didymosphaeria variabile]KAJ4353200.1 Aquaporin-1 [Didymosphaeria variabile]